MKKFNTILAVAAVALTSVFGFASCEQDDDFDYMPTKTTTLAQDTVRGTRGEIKAPQDPTDPFRGGLTYHFGDKVTKKISNYGNAEFVCISDKAPYYFIHVSSKKYSMSEKDAMSYSQTGYAATTDKLKEVAKEIQPRIFSWIKNYECKYISGLFGWGTEGYLYTWKTADIMNAANTLSNYIPAFTANTEKTSKSSFIITSEEFWISNSHDYPYACIEWNLYGDVQMDGRMCDSPNNNVDIEDAHHWSYASPCLGHRFFFIAKTND